jgi:N utilization substance protein B
MQSRSLSRELALLMLGQTKDRGGPPGRGMEDVSLDQLLQQAQMSLSQHVRDALDRSAEDLQQAHNDLLESELRQQGEPQLPLVRQHLRDGLEHAEVAINRLSACLDLPRLLMLSDQDEVRHGALERTKAVLRRREAIDAALDRVMEGWRLTRLPRIDRDILRLAVVDLDDFSTPPAVACNEALELAHRYSDDQGRRMIHGVLRRYTTAKV